MKKTPLIVLIVFLVIVGMVIIVMIKRGADQDFALKSLEKKGLDLEALPMDQQDLVSLNERDDMIRLMEPAADSILSSPLTIRGEARGDMFFEASFPIELVDETGAVLATTIAQAQADWMTHEFVPFKAVMEFKLPPKEKVKLVFKNDNPSGLEIYDLKYEWEFMLR